MAVNVSVYDLANYPSNPKTVSVDVTEVVPYGNSGEDTWVFSAITTATASGGASIQRLYISDIKFGWIKSSGLQSGPYTINDSQKNLKIAIDEDISEAVEITLATSDLTLGGNTVAADLQAKISAAGAYGGDKAGNLSYLNAVCTYEDGVFKIVSGTASDVYAGSTRSSVAIADGTSTTGLAAELGFDISFSSETLASTQVRQTSLAAPYTTGTALTVAASSVVSDADCIVITDGTNTEYRGVESSAGVGVTLSSGLDNGYALGSLVQVLEIQEPAGGVPPAYSTVDDVIKYAIASIANQINFAS